ncbi:histidine kinase [Cohnella sp. WQ 127256]|uniref:hybrid sensor histidine kinase/response regulator n=1 Tax=Cohnella sp. WQ 127256 TaxID=2938790 RepID=UPI0021189EA4|nr:histidine kinase [Cohnella sp. WQ 127256]
MKKWIKDRFLIGFFLLTVIVGFAMWLPGKIEQAAPRVSMGELDLSKWDSKEDGVLKLDGQWEFYPNVLLTPENLAEQKAKKGFIQVPGEWDGWQDDEGVAMKGMGFGTYRLLIKNAPMNQSLALTKNYVRFADKLYVNGVLMGQSGRTAESEEDYLPRNAPYTVYFHTTGSEVEILLQATNFDYKSGGISNSLFFGLAKDIEVKKSIQVGLELMVTIIVLMFSVLNISLYIWFHRNRLLILLAAFFFIYAISVLTNGERLFLQLLPNLPFEVAFKIKTISVFMPPALQFLISRNLLGKSLIRKLLLISAVLLSTYCVGIAILPFHIYSQVQDFIYLGITLMYIVQFIHLMKSYMNGQYGRLDKRQFQIYFAAIWSQLLTGIVVVLSNQIVISMILTNLTVLLFVVFISMLLIHQYIGAYSSMTKLTRQLQMADQMKDEFLLITSHELNTPLHGIINLSQSLLKEPLRRSTENDMKKKLNLIRNTAYRMSNMVKDIIDVARIKDGKLEVEVRRVDLVICVLIVFEVFGFLAKGKNTQLVHGITPEARFVLADENRLMQVLYNVINHSLIHIHDGVVSINSRSTETGVIIQIGKTANLQETNNGDNTRDEEEDNGFAVGLSVAHELVVLMGGEFVLDAGEGNMEIFLPAALEDGFEEVAAGMEDELFPLEQEAGVEVEKVKKVTSKILIASADPVNVEHLYGMLIMEGFDVICAGTDTESYAAITRLDRPDLVLLDVMLPDTNGYELCRRIRQHFTQVELPVLFISARSTPADIEFGIAAGGSDFITRPLDAGEIRVRINTLLSMKRLVKAAAVNEMAFLRSQIKPHFLYNALGTIMSLCYTDGVRAGELLGTFSRYLRIIFHLDNTEETVRLSKEMELIQAYADIEKERFGERIRVEFDVDKELYGIQVMPLTIEPLVENAIRHGVSKKVSGGTVRLTIQRQDEFVQVIVEDDGIGMTPEQIKSILGPGMNEQGVGFRNIMRRVAHLTGKQPLVESELGKGTKVTIWLPLMYS